MNTKLVPRTFPELMKLANLEGANKDAKIYVGRSTTMYNLLFYT